MNNNSKTIVGVIIGILVLASIVWFARPSSPGPQQANLNSETSGMLAIQEPVFDFGTISMAAGNVSHEFKIKNDGNKPVTIEKMYTSCMCTTAKLTVSGKIFGPYGMPGHGLISGINKTLAPNEKALVEVVFDPTAHGPAGVGRIERVVYLENSGGRPLELKISATVTP